MPAEGKFTPATPDNSGVVAKHIHDVHWVCQQDNTFLFVRPSTVATMRLIAEGFATKSMDIHDKSSDWGLTSGFVPVDPAFSKKQTGQPNPGIHPHGHGQALPVHLAFTASQAQNLLGRDHFEHTTEVMAESACPAPASLAQVRHFHSSRNPKVCFLWDRKSGQVHWQWRDGRQPNPRVPMWVWGYQGVPVTGDYDMWMVAPHLDKVRGEREVFSIKDAHGRSAATRFTEGLIGHLNAGCNRTAKPVFNHGAEAQNVSFTQALDKRLAVFCPGKMAPFVISRVLLPGLLHDLLRHGYVVVRNPKWLHGTTLGIEDMADAAESFPDDPAVQVGVKEVAKLKRGAATAIARAWQKKKGHAPIDPDAVWSERYNELRYFRALGGMPEAQDQDLVLPDSAFPASGPGSGIDAEGEAARFATEVESSFGRTGFIKEGGHVSPVDATRKKAPAKQGFQRLLAYHKEKIGEG